MIKHLRGQLKGENVYSNSKLLIVQFVASWSIRAAEAYHEQGSSLHGGQNVYISGLVTGGNHQKQVPVAYLIHLHLPLKVVITSPDRFPTRQQTSFT